MQFWCSLHLEKIYPQNLALMFNNNNAVTLQHEIWPHGCEHWPGYYLKNHSRSGALAPSRRKYSAHPKLEDSLRSNYLWGYLLWGNPYTVKRSCRPSFLSDPARQGGLSASNRMITALGFCQSLIAISTDIIVNSIWWWRKKRRNGTTFGNRTQLITSCAWVSSRAQ